LHAELGFNQLDCQKLVVAHLTFMDKEKKVIWLRKLYGNQITCEDLPRVPTDKELTVDELNGVEHEAADNKLDKDATVDKTDEALAKEQAKEHAMEDMLAAETAAVDKKGCAKEEAAKTEAKKVEVAKQLAEMAKAEAAKAEAAKAKANKDVDAAHKEVEKVEDAEQLAEAEAQAEIKTEAHAKADEDAKKKLVEEAKDAVLEATDPKNWKEATRQKRNRWTLQGSLRRRKQKRRQKPKPTPWQMSITNRR